MRSYYEVLNVSRDAEDVVVRAAYRAMMARYHPDTSQADPASAERYAKLLNEAYATLRDPSRRRLYDVWLRSQKAASGHRDDPQSEPRGAEPRNSGKASSSANAPVKAVVAAPSDLDRRGFRHAWLALVIPLLTWVILSESSSEAISADIAPTTIVQGPPATPVEASATPDADWNTVSPTTANENEADAEAVQTADAGFSSTPLKAESHEVEGMPESIGNERPDLSGVSEEDRRTIDLACVTQDGIVAKNSCLRSEAAQLRTGHVRPNLSRVSEEDRRTIEMACVTEDGIIAKNGCLQRQTSYLTPANRRPNLSRISEEDRRTIEMACVTEDGIIAKNRCLRSEVRSLTGE